MSFSKFSHKLRQISLFRDLTDDQMNSLISHVKEISLAEGEWLLKEGEAGTDLFFIEEGEVEILKKNPSNGRDTFICAVGRGEVVGEMAFIKAGRREASVRALKPTRLLVISVHIEKTDPLYMELKSCVSEIVSERLKEENRVVLKEIAANVEHTKAREGLGNLLVHLVGLIFLYIYAMRVIAILNIQVISSTIISTPILLLFAISMFTLIKSSGYPMSQYGFTWKGGGRATIEAILYCIPIFAIIALVKWTVINLFPTFHNLKLFNIFPAVSNGSASLSSMTVAILVVLYALFVPIQEFIFRGAIQSSLEQFQLGKHRTLQAILISNLPFSMIHLHLSFSLSVTAYFTGLFWGWMYSRQRTLVGCCISHFLIGIWSFFIVGIQDFLVV